MNAEPKLILSNDVAEMVAAALSSKAEHGGVYARLIAAVFDQTTIFLNDEARRGTNPAHVLFALRDLFSSNAGSVIAYAVMPGKERELATVFLSSVQESFLHAVDSIAAHKRGRR